MQDMFANMRSWFYVTELLCHRRSDFGNGDIESFEKLDSQS